MQGQFVLYVTVSCSTMPEARLLREKCVQWRPRRRKSAEGEPPAESENQGGV
ncbi:hypothetical protein RCO48_19795 [Peribacillus frigoritolerans]|nr:hypothetical protein [Peribacillus frigoritolerans]